LVAQDGLGGLGERGVDALEQRALVAGGVLGQVDDALAEQVDLAPGGGVEGLAGLEHAAVGLGALGQGHGAGLEEPGADRVAHLGGLARRVAGRGLAVDRGGVGGGTGGGLLGAAVAVRGAAGEDQGQSEGGGQGGASHCVVPLSNSLVFVCVFVCYERATAHGCLATPPARAGVLVACSSSVSQPSTPRTKPAPFAHPQG